MPYVLISPAKAQGQYKYEFSFFLNENKIANRGRKEINLRQAKYQRCSALSTHFVFNITCVAGVFSLLEELFTWDTIELWVEISQRTLEYTLFDGTIDMILPLVESIHFFKTRRRQTSK